MKIRIFNKNKDASTYLFLLEHDIIDKDYCYILTQNYKQN